jgi:hypothetical protein
VLRRIFGLKMDDVMGGWRKLQTKEVHNYQDEEDEVGGACGVNGAYRILIEKSEGKRPIGNPRCRWVDNIKMNLIEIGLG